MTRALAEHPDEVVEAFAVACPHCAHQLTEADQSDAHAYDHIEIPPIRPVVTRIRLHRGKCPCCRRKFTAPPPEAMTPGSPFGPNIVALIVHLHVTQMIGFERLSKMMAEMFSLTISEGAIANILARAEPRLGAAADVIAAEVRASAVIASDETSARVQGRNWWQWVMSSSTAVYHVIADTRAAGVIADFLDGAVPEVWVADRYAGQNNHALQRQVCLAHLLRDAQYAIDAGDTGFAPAFHKLLKQACAIAARRPPSATPPWRNIDPPSKAAGAACSLARPHPTPAKSSSAPSSDAGQTSSSSSSGATFHPPTTSASGHCGPR